ncbi:MAG: hypothetical protein K2J76_00435 [Oscillospiraceae bacterium]|nr:hypothetical protein [Oscillospiraceae bacterium]
MSSIFQNSLLGLFISNRSVIENAEKILPAVTIINCVKSLVTSAVNILMCKSKCIHAPLIITAVTLGIFPIACSYASRVQILYYVNQGEVALT